MSAMNIKSTILLLVTGLLVSNAFGGSDGFDSIKCGSDIAKALIGKRLSNEPVEALEKRHPDLGLKDLGAEEISYRLNGIFWLICGSEYLVLEDGSIVKDVLRFLPIQRPRLNSSVCAR